MIGESVFLEQGGERTRAAAETQRVDTEHGHVRIYVVALVASGFVFAREGFAHDHPERVASGDAVSAGEHEFVGVRMLGAPIVEAEAAEVGTGEMDGDVVGRVGEGSPE